MAERELDPGTPWRRDLDAVTPAMQQWVTKHVGDDAIVENLASPANGMSSETVLFDLVRNGAREQYAARLAPLPELYPVFPEYDLELQATCMRLVGQRTDVPAPEVRWVEHDTAWLGAPFLVMPRIDGISPPDVPPYVFMGWVLEASDDERARLQHGAVDVLAQVARDHAGER